MAETMFASTIKQMKVFFTNKNAPTKALLPFLVSKTLLPVRFHLWYRVFLFGQAPLSNYDLQNFELPKEIKQL